ncbi:cytochrome P450 2U1-like [Amphiura filiformis]|uniref:cytochrome P450 2U1-like n=1 Tax=Amphiura filiformis TaxID=82378 RepID=UPI003B219A5D
MEVQRYATLAPLGVPHEVVDDTFLQGYAIPKGAIILANIWAIHHDPEVWTNPEEFRPERFLDDEGNICQPKEYMPFSVGLRKCVGENLAKKELFIVFSSLLHRFTFKTPPGVETSLEGTLGASFVPKPYEIIVINRD